MTPATWLALVSLLVSLGVLIFNAGRGAARMTGLEREFARQANEIEKLRAWHHKITDDPMWAATQMLTLFDERLSRLEDKEP